MFLASIESEGGRHSDQTVVIKFARIYDAGGHRLLADAGHAPELLYYSIEDLGGLIVVVTGCVLGETAHKRYGINPLPQAIFNQVEDAMPVLHAENIVFGDLRPPNIMVTEQERVMPIDFDWCGARGRNLPIFVE